MINWDKNAQKSVRRTIINCSGLNRFVPQTCTHVRLLGTYFNTAKNNSPNKQNFKRFFFKNDQKFHVLPLNCVKGRCDHFWQLEPSSFVLVKGYIYACSTTFQFLISQKFKRNFSVRNCLPFSDLSSEFRRASKLQTGPLNHHADPRTFLQFRQMIDGHLHPHRKPSLSFQNSSL